MRRLLVLLLAASFVASPALAQQSQSNEGARKKAALTPLSDLLDHARANASVIAEHDAKIRVAQWQQYRAKWAWGPKVRNDLVLAPVPSNADPDQFGQNLDEIGSLNLGPYVRESLQIVIPVYTFDRISTARELAEVGLDVANLRRDKATREVEFEVKRAYYSLQLSQAFDALLSEGSGIIKEKLADMEEAREFGEGDFSTEDLRKLQIFDAEVDARVLDNQKLGRMARAGLGYFTNVEAETIEVAALDTDTSLPPLASLETYQRYAQMSRPEVAMLARAVRARNLQVELQKSNFYPNVAIVGEFGLGWSTEEIALQSVCRRPTDGGPCVDTEDLYARPYSNPLDFLSVKIGLALRWELDFWQLRGKFGEAKAHVDEVMAQRERALGAIQLEIRKLWLDAAQAREKVDITARRLEAARRWRDQFGLKLETAGADLSDAVEPLKAFFEARALHLQARYDYLVARAALAQAVGVASLAEVTASEDSAE